MMNKPQRFDSEFPLDDEPPTTPHRTISGSLLNGTMIRAMAEQQAAFKRCYQSLDDLIVQATRLNQVKEALQ